MKHRLINQIILTAITILVMLSPLMQPVASASEDADVLLTSAAESMLELDSFHFLLTTPTGKTLLTPELELKRIEGDFVAPDRFRADAEVTAIIASLIISVIGIGDRLWVSDPFTSGDKMIPVQGDETGATPIPKYVNPEYLVSLALTSIQSPVIAGNETIDGVSTTKITGTIDPAQAVVDGTPVALVAGSSELIEVTIWIDEQDRVVRVEFDGPLTASEIGTGKIVRRLDLSRFDEPITVEEPAA